MDSLYNINLSSTKSKILHLIGIVIVLGLFFIPYDKIRTERIRAFGEKKVVGIVIEKDVRKVEHAQDNNMLSSMTVRYRFIDPSGLPYERVAEVEPYFWKRISAGDSVLVYFAKANPAISRIEHEQEDRVVKLLALLSRKEHNSHSN